SILILNVINNWFFISLNLEELFILIFFAVIHRFHCYSTDLFNILVLIQPLIMLYSGFKSIKKIDELRLYSSR
ncbi:hypothetical protein AB204_01465, partial [Xenorhabdus khoisanae]